ncbi:MAG TPA: 4Fe-4S dicluster domain-containing protein [Archaeoglobaceae archaeon]|nr:4Fe-4S dicluster domain-containing protein [Archaeoglobaceae archaeon]
MIAIANYCVGCAFCMFVCPEEAISVLGNAEIDRDKCSECKRCMRYCPVEAIRFVR